MQRSRDTEQVPRLVPDVVAAGTISSMTQPHLAIDDELELRPFRDEDVDVVVAAFATPDIQYFHFRRLDHTEALRWIEDSRNSWQWEKSATWAIELRSQARAIGRVTIYLSLAEGRGEVSYWVLPDGRGRGVATRACRTATRWAHSIGLHRVELQHSTINDASQRVALAAGFVREGVRRGAGVLVDGWHDMVLYAHLSSDVR
jgi:RimJ/RimL family protein N-acetyltransferase